MVFIIEDLSSEVLSSVPLWLNISNGVRLVLPCESTMLRLADALRGKTTGALPDSMPSNRNFFHSRNVEADVVAALSSGVHAQSSVYVLPSRESGLTYADHRLPETSNDGAANTHLCGKKMPGSVAGTTGMNPVLPLPPS